MALGRVRWSHESISESGVIGPVRHDERQVCGQDADAVAKDKSSSTVDLGMGKSQLS